MSEPLNDWLHDFHTRLGVPDSRRTVCARALVAWRQSEGGAVKGLPRRSGIPEGQVTGLETDFNPFNTTKPWGGSHPQPGNSVPVQVYTSRENGMLATLSTIREPRYQNIRAAMMTPGVHARTICKRIVESEWGTTAHPMLDVLEDITKRGLYDFYASIPIYPS
jgi:hypothetical protein